MGALALGVVQEPIQGEILCGDAYGVHDLGGHVIVAVADGLGHGPEAHAVAERAMAYVAAHADHPVAQLLEGCHRDLRGSRGVVMAVARIDRAAGKLDYGGIGNIEARILGAEKVLRPISMNGIVGHTAAKIRVETFPFLAGDLLLVHSDGISDRFEISPASRGRDPQVLAHELVFRHGRATDDRLLLLVREDA